MSATLPTNAASVGPSEAARPGQSTAGDDSLLRADWTNVVFLHYEVGAEGLQHCVPVSLDLWEGRAFVSLVAFTMRRLRPERGGRFTAWLMRPFAEQRFLNVRTYVRCRGEPGIYFIAEWNSHRPSVWLAPKTYGLPYRFGKIEYEHDAGLRRGCGLVSAGEGALRFKYECDGATFGQCASGSLEEFLLERYLAFTCRGGVIRRFRVSHEPWLQRRGDWFETEDNLLGASFGWWAEVERTGVHVSPGVCDVRMSRPRRVT